MPTTRKRKHAHSESPEPQIDESTLMDGQNELPAELQIWESFREEYIESVFILLSMMSTRYSWIFWYGQLLTSFPFHYIEALRFYANLIHNPMVSFA